ncbi:hypothetical protein EYF80_061370 [Liparis tanakae]|uniref:Uncharacterized protein n=1 Tax=Liparis tanakae TaxID=230148 RepID=A0A4Z2EJG5_9TELE|nr:hypothetical protein EYF80_061370 [Liparis tanakae]
MPWMMISGWNEAGRWLDSSVHRFKFRLRQTALAEAAAADHIIIPPHLSAQKKRKRGTSRTGCEWRTLFGSARGRPRNTEIGT